jgi:hypothetical protein
METVQMRIAPGRHDLEDGVKLPQSRLAAYQHPALDERTDALQDDAQLVDTTRCGSGCHALRVAQRVVSLKGSPWYLALSAKRRNRWPSANTCMLLRWRTQFHTVLYRGS